MEPWGAAHDPAPRGTTPTSCASVAKLMLMNRWPYGMATDGTARRTSLLYQKSNGINISKLLAPLWSFCPVGVWLPIAVCVSMREVISLLATPLLTQLGWTTCPLSTSSCPTHRFQPKSLLGATRYSLCKLVAWNVY